MADVDLLIVGGGAAGMAAALAAEKAGLCRILLADREPVLGGVLPQCVHRGFGQGYFGEDLTGPEYAERFAKRLAASAVEYLPDTTVLSVAENRTAVLSGAVCGYRAVSFRHLILATGCRETPIGALPVAGTRPAGVFTAGQAQALVNLRRYDVGSEIVILGSGDIGLIMARQFTLLGKHVIAVIEQEAVCGGMPRNIRECIEAIRIPSYLRDVSEVPERRLTGVKVRDATAARNVILLHAGYRRSADPGTGTSEILRKRDPRMDFALRQLRLCPRDRGRRDFPGRKAWRRRGKIRIKETEP
jgi:NADPH-dependent 2,4-dienoyl-CoA reductase/sulfur reductase-like enzyme